MLKRTHKMKLQLIPVFAFVCLNIGATVQGFAQTSEALNQNHGLSVSPPHEISIIAPKVVFSEDYDLDGIHGTQKNLEVLNYAHSDLICLERVQATEGWHDPESMTLESEMIGFVVKGTLGIETEFNICIVEEGTAFTIPYSMRHRIINLGEGEIDFLLLRGAKDSGGDIANN